MSSFARLLKLRTLEWLWKSLSERSLCFGFEYRDRNEAIFIMTDVVRKAARTCLDLDLVAVDLYPCNRQAVGSPVGLISSDSDRERT